MNQPAHKTALPNRTQTMRFYPFVSTGKERDEETGYGYFGARDHELTAMWLSVDPMADKYPSISPYAYCAWNPIKIIDPDGQDIYYKEGGSVYIYKKNTEGEYGFYNYFTGEIYSGDNQKYVDNLKKALGQLKEGKIGNKLVSFFEGHQKHHLFIKESDKNGQKGREINWNDTDKTRLPVVTTIFDLVDIEPAETFISLGHEMAHARDTYKFGDKFNDMSRKEKEQSAMLTENLIRLEHGFKQRSFYGLENGGFAVDHESYPAFVLPSILTSKMFGRQ